MPKDPLAGLDGIDWTRLHHVYGRTSDVAGQLRALASADAEQRRHAHDQLRSNVYHQGTWWQGSYAVVSFLAALVNDPSVTDRASIVRLLRLIAVGDGDDTSLPFDPDTAFPRADEITEGDAEALAVALSDEKELDDDWIDLSRAADDRWHATPTELPQPPRLPTQSR